MNPTSTPYCFSFENPPPISDRDIIFPPDTHHLYVWASILVANIVSDECNGEMSKYHDRNPLPILVYNTISTNGYRNRYFATLVSLLLVFARMATDANRATNIETSVEKYAPSAVLTFSYMLLRETPELFNAANNRIITSVEEAYNNLMTISPTVNTLAPGLLVRLVPGYNTAPSQYRPNTGGQYRPATASPNTNPTNGRLSAYAESTKPAPVSIADTYLKGRNMPTEQPVPVAAPVTPKHWSSHNEQKYAPLLKKNYQSAELVTTSVGRVNIVALDLRKDDMDRAKHRIQSRIEKLAPPVTPKLSEEKFQRNITDFIAASREYIESDRELKVFKKSGTTVTGPSSLFLEAQEAFSPLNHKPEDDRQITLMEFSVADYVCDMDVDLIDTVTEPFASATTNAEIVSAMESVMLAIESTDDTSAIREQDATFIKHLDKRLTARVNAILANELSIPDVQIDSYYEDCLELETRFLTENYSEHYASAFTKATAMLGSRDAFYSNSKSETADEDERQRHLYRVTSAFLGKVNIHSDYLNMEVVDPAMTGDVPALVTLSLHPILYEACRAVVSLAGKHIADYYLLTEDGERYKVYQGHLARDAYLIRKLP